LDTARQDELYETASASHGGAIARLARAYEADPDKRAELRQEIHFALWRSFAGFDHRCSLRTWVYRVAHNIAAAHITRNKRQRQGLLSLDTLDTEGPAVNPDADRHIALARLLELIQRLEPLDRQVMSLYLEGESAADIGEITGYSANNIAQKIHRIKSLLSRQFAGGQRVR
jgi:RNA polymerase sigma-70 factor (ECF subfamily)